MKGLPICFSEVQVKNDVTDNNNKHFVTAFEGECRNIIELREHLKLCFLIILKLPLGLCAFWKRELYFMGVSAPMTMSRSSEGELNLVGRFRSRSESRDQKTLPAM